MSKPEGARQARPSAMADVIHNVLFEEVEYREGRRIRRASKQELTIRKLFSAAVRGDVGSADALLKLRVHAERHGDTGPLVIKIVNDPDDDAQEQWIKERQTSLRQGCRGPDEKDHNDRTR
jgi:hypothetical protein